MRVAFAGTPPFAAQALEALRAAQFDIPVVLTQPDRPAGRGMRLTPSAVKSAAVAAGITVMQPASLKDPAVQAELLRYPVEHLVVAAYGLILPREILAWPRRGCLNIHASLLPRWRGAAPLQRALLEGDAETGVSIMQMDEGLDTGPVLMRESVAIAPRETGGSLHDKLAALGAKLIVMALERESHSEPLPRIAQAATGASYAAKLGAADCRIDWTDSTQALDRKIRALDPGPGAVTRLRGEPCKVWRAEPAAGAGRPGEILEVGRGGLLVACGQGALRIFELQAAGSRRMASDAFLAGHALRPGERMG